MRRGIFLLVLIIVVFVSWMNLYSPSEDIDDDVEVEIMENQLEVIEKTDDSSDFILSEDLIIKKFDLDMVLKHDSFIRYNNSPNKLVHIYMVSDDQYTRLVVDTDIENGSPVPILMNRTINEVYYFFPEYTTVKATTVSDDKTINELLVHEIVLSGSETEAGGDFKLRVFKQDVSVDFNVINEFSLYGVFNANEITESSEIYGKYIFKLTTN